MNHEEVVVKYMPQITENQLWDFYVRNDICEVGYGKETAVIPLKYHPYIVGAFYEDKLVGIIRATFDGLSADIKEFCLECELQGTDLKYNNGFSTNYRRNWITWFICCTNTFGFWKYRNCCWFSCSWNTINYW